MTPVTIGSPETELVIRYLRTNGELSEAPTKLASDHHDQIHTGIWTTHEASQMILADRLRSLLTPCPYADLTPAVHTDLLELALSRVNWHQVAAALL
jgi:hypothetical protein